MHPFTFTVLRDENFLRREAENSYNYILNTIYPDILLLLLVYFHGCLLPKDGHISSMGALSICDFQQLFKSTVSEAKYWVRCDGCKDE